MAVSDRSGPVKAAPQAQHVPMPRHVRELSSRAGAEQVVAELRAYWRQVGGEVQFWFEGLSHRSQEFRQPITCIRSDMLNGWPRE